MGIELKDYEVNLKRLLEIVNELENSNTSLEDNIKLYKEGIELYDGLKSLLSGEAGKIGVYTNGEMKEADLRELGGFDSD